MRKLDVKEIHGYDASEGLKLVRHEALAKVARPAAKRAA
jgi:arginine decarboxylase